MRAIDSRAQSYVATIFAPEGALHPLIDEDPNVVVTVSVVSEGKTLITGVSVGGKTRIEVPQDPPPKPAKKAKEE